MKEITLSHPKHMDHRTPNNHTQSFPNFSQWSSPNLSLRQHTYRPATDPLMHTAHKIGKQFLDLARTYLIGWLYTVSQS